MGPIVKLLLGILLLFGLALWVQRDFRADVAAFKDRPNDPQLLLKGVTVVGWNQMQRRWEFSSDLLQVDHKGRFLTYKGRGIGRLFEKNRPFITVWAPKLRFDMLTKSVEAAGGVFMKATDGTELRCGELFWNQFSQRLYVPGKVIVRNKSGKAWAHHLILVAHNGTLKVLGVHMVFDPGLLPQGILR